MKTVLEAIRTKRIGRISVILTPIHHQGTSNVVLEVEARVNGKPFFYKEYYQMPELETWWDHLFKKVQEEMREAILREDV